MKVGEPTSEDDPLWRVTATGGDEDDGPTGVARRHDRCLTEAVADFDDDDERVADEAPAFTLDDPPWRLVGIGRRAEPTNVAREKDGYLADAFDIHRT
jgi:hypothetical protein